jgi:hypothetical protein
MEIGPDAGTDPPNPLKPPIFLTELPSVPAISFTLICKFVAGTIAGIYYIENSLKV